MSKLMSILSEDLQSLTLRKPVMLSGRVSRFDGSMIYCDGFPAGIGALCHVEIDGGESAVAEIIGFENGKNILSLHEIGARIKVGSRVTLVDEGDSLMAGDALMGRVFDALGNPIDNLPDPILSDSWPLMGKKLNPLSRAAIDKPMDVGVRAINSLLSVGRGQRLGIIAGSGVGKSVLLGMMTRFTSADVVVVGLIGERGREVGEFVRTVMTDETRKRTIVVAVPSNHSPLLRIRGASRATAIAEYFRDQGKDVLLIMDSLTRVAHAQREIGLALGEQPTSKGYPPSVISLIPRLIERTGTGMPGQGSITSFYTVLADGDDANDPVVDTSRAILDGHILLSRDNAQLGIYPAVDIPSSISRVMNDMVNDEHQQAARQFRRLVSLYTENRDLFLMGGYVQGQDPELDVAIKLWPDIVSLISQNASEKANFEESRQALINVVGNM